MSRDASLIRTAQFRNRAAEAASAVLSYTLEGRVALPRATATVIARRLDDLVRTAVLETIMVVCPPDPETVDGILFAPRCQEVIKGARPGSMPHPDLVIVDHALNVPGVVDLAMAKPCNVVDRMPLAVAVRLISDAATAALKDLAALDPVYGPAEAMREEALSLMVASLLSGQGLATCMNAFEDLCLPLLTTPNFAFELLMSGNLEGLSALFYTHFQKSPEAALAATRSPRAFKHAALALWSNHDTAEELASLLPKALAARSNGLCPPETRHTAVSELFAEGYVPEAARSEMDDPSLHDSSAVDCANVVMFNVAAHRPVPRKTSEIKEKSSNPLDGMAG